MAYCQNCGTTMKDDQKFCANCGASAAPQQNAAPPPQYQQPMPERTPYEQDVDKNKGFAIISYISFLSLVSYFAAERSPYARFHAVQGLNLFILEAIVGVVGGVIRGIFYWVPFFSRIMGGVLGLLSLGFLALSIIGIVAAARGEQKPLPVVDAFKFVKN